MISIVIPVYNTKKEYLDECVHSAINQNYKDVEIIIIDDGSREDVARWCDLYAEEDLRVRVIHKKNEGVSIARNIGIEEAKGDWIFFLDSDDFIEMDAFSQIDSYEKFDVVAFKYRTKEYEKSFTSDDYYDMTIEINKKEQAIQLLKEMLINNEHTSSIGISTAKLYSLKFIKKYNIKFKAGISFREDTIFNISIFENVSRMLFVNKVVYNYRINSDSATQKRDEKCKENSEKLITACEEVLAGKYMDEYYAFVIWQLNYVFIKAVFCEEISSNKKAHLKNILKYEEYQNAIKNVKLPLLSKRKKILVILLRIKCYYLLNLLYAV